MLRALSVENIAVARQLDIELGDGFSVITGKTGAGKSVLMDSIALLLGAKASRELVRYGENTASVSAIFCGDAGKGIFDENGEACLCRTVSVDGRGGAKINGRSVSVAALKEVASSLLSIHGQNESSTLYDKSAHVLILDDYTGCTEAVDKYHDIYLRLTEKRNEIAELKKSMADKNMMVDILKYQIAEIDKLRITDAGEEEKLEKMRLKLKNLEAVTKNANLVYRALAPGEKGASAAYLLDRAAAALRQLSDVMDGAEQMADKLEEYRVEVIDIAETARSIIDDDGVSDSERQLDRVETRLAAISRLEKKYGATLEDVMAFRDDAKRRLRDLEAGDDRIAELESEYKALRRDAVDAAAVITELRREGGKRLSEEIMETLKFLDMPKVRFFVEVRQNPAGEEKFGPRGCDSVDFTVVTNPGEEPQSLSKIASGGEVSRIMLALKCAEAKKKGVGCVIFDEIDTGVSGGTSERIGIKLSELSRDAQVICVTHSAQVAAHAAHHYLIEKKEVDGRAESFVKELSGDERVGEIARIIGGINITDKQMNAAVEMLSQNK